MQSIDFVTSGILFLHEQDGPPEKMLKKLVLPVLETDRQVRRAYLARIQIAEADLQSVMMAIVRDGGASRQLNDKIATIFHGLFSTHNSLDVAFISALEETELAEVCEPFYERAPQPKGWFQKLLG